MKHKYGAVSVLILTVTLLLGIVCLLTLRGEIAVHWDSFGQADDFRPVWQGVLISLATALLCLWAWAIVRKRYEDWFAWKTSLRVVCDGILGGLSCLGIILELVFLLSN